MPVLKQPFATLTVEHSSTVERVADELRRALFDGEIEVGTPLREVALADSLGVARSTIREALGTLVAEGLATREPNRGVHVTELDPGAVEDVCCARIVLETAGVRRWAEATDQARADVRDALVRFEEAATEGTPSDFTTRHMEFHRALVALTGSDRLVAQAETLYAEIRLALARVDRLRRNQVEQIQTHRRLVELLEAGDVAVTVQALEQHIEDGGRSMLEAVAGPDASPPDPADQ